MAETTIVPFSTLPACAASCGPLYDVNGRCVPPATTVAAVEVYQQCFCSDSRLTAFSTATNGPCDAACAATPADFGGITNWYKSMCASVQGLGRTTTNAAGATSAPSPGSGGGGGGWISSHWQWVVFIVVMVLGIAGIWIGAAIWRRHYLRKKDRQHALGKNLAQRTGSGHNPYGGPLSGRETPNRSGSVRVVRPGGGGGTVPDVGNADAEKPRRNFWGRS